jgi:hypothetical protein
MANRGCLIQIKLGSSQRVKVGYANRACEGYLAMIQSGESKGATRPITRSKASERWIFLLETVTFIVAFFYLLGVFS